MTVKQGVYHGRPQPGVEADYLIVEVAIRKVPEAARAPASTPAVDDDERTFEEVVIIANYRDLVMTPEAFTSLRQRDPA